MSVVDESLRFIRGAFVRQSIKPCRFGLARGPIPKFASTRSASDANFGSKRGTRNFMILVRVLNLKFVLELAAQRNFKFTALERFPTRLTNLPRHGRARPGHPRLVCGTIDVDARNKSGHDGGGFGSDQLLHVLWRAPEMQAAGIMP